MEHAWGGKVFLPTILGLLAIGDYLDYGQFVTEGSEFILQTDRMVGWLRIVRVSINNAASPAGECAYLNLVETTRNIVLLLCVWFWLYGMVLYLSEFRNTASHWYHSLS